MFVSSSTAVFGMALLAFGALTALNGLMGYAIVKLLVGRRSFAGWRTEWAMLVFTCGALFNGWLALTLTELGWFSVWLWGGLVGGLAAVVLFALRQRAITYQWDERPLPLPVGGWVWPHWVEWVLVGVWLVAAVGLYFRPHEYLWGGADVGVYTNLAAHIAHTGGIVIHDEVLAGLDEALYPAFLRVMSTPQGDNYFWSSGFTVPDTSGRISPPFYHLAPVWQAIAYVLLGTEGALRATGYWMVWASAAVFLVLRRLISHEQWWLAWVGLAALTICALQVWFARYATTEALTQYLFWVGLWAFIRWGDEAYDEVIWGAVAGVAWGSTFLARIDTFFVWIIPVILVAYLLYQRRLGRGHLPFFLALLVLPLQATLHALLFSRFYFDSVYGYMLLVMGQNWVPLLGTAVLGLGILWLLWRQADLLLGWVARIETPLRGLAMLAIAAFFLYGWFVRPAWGTPYTYINPWDNIAVEAWNHENLVRLGWYLSPLGILLAVLGILRMVWQANQRTWAFLLLGLLFTALYLWNIRSNAIQVYAMRRYVPVVVPFFIGSGALLLDGWRGKWRQTAVVALAAVWLFSVGWHARGFVSQIDMPDYQQNVAAIAAQLPPNSILLFNQNVPISMGDHVGVPLHFLYGHHLFVLYHMEKLDTAVFQRTLGEWHTAGYPIFWVEIPQNHPWPLADVPLEPAFEFAIPVSFLEGTYTHKPTAIMEGVWAAEVWRVVPPAP